MSNRSKRILMSVLGVVLAGVSVGFLKRAAFGVDPFQTFMSGLDSLLPISFGTLYVIASLVLLTFSLISDRHYIGLATFVTLFFQGYVIDFSREILFSAFPVMQSGGRFLFLMIGIVLLCLASSVYFTADPGVSTYDAVSLIIANTWKVGKFKYNRIICDLVCVCFGSGMYLISGGEINGLTAIVGAGTIITAFFMGPLIEFFNERVARPLLNS